MTSLKDVAKRAGVAVGTVSRYLNEPQRLRESTRQKIEPAIKALGYSPNAVARSLRRGKTGLVMVTCSVIGDPYFGDVIRGIDRAAQRHGFAVLVKEVPPVRWSFEMVRDLILSRAADGVIVLGSSSPFDLGADADSEIRYPPVVVGAEIVSTAMRRLPSVQIDNVAATEELTRFVVGLGHRRIAFMTGERGSAMMDDREVGFRNVLAAHGIEIPWQRFAYGDLIIDGGRKATRALMNQPDPPTAIVCANDEMAIGAMMEIRAMGLAVPDDVSIVGFDDIRYAEAMNPPLTTVAQPREEIGERCFYRLLNAMDDPLAETGVQIVPHRLVVRASAAAPRQ
jgi:LacI family repressor for deo operon, udp, cdd, tsx, nupC, and nupG